MDVGFHFSWAEFQGKDSSGFSQQRRQGFSSSLPAAPEITQSHHLGLGYFTWSLSAGPPPAWWAPPCSQEETSHLSPGTKGSVSLVQASAPFVGENLDSVLSGEHLAFTSKSPRERTPESSSQGTGPDSVP